MGARVTVETAGAPVYEVLTVIEWRIDQLRRAGVQQPAAALLAECDADLHVILTAKAAGCDDHTLRRIFT